MVEGTTINSLKLGHHAMWTCDAHKRSLNGACANLGMHESIQAGTGLPLASQTSTLDRPRPLLTCNVNTSLMTLLDPCSILIGLHICEQRLLEDYKRRQSRATTHCRSDTQITRGSSDID